MSRKKKLFFLIFLEMILFTPVIPSNDPIHPGVYSLLLPFSSRGLFLGMTLFFQVFLFLGLNQYIHVFIPRNTPIHPCLLLIPQNVPINPFLFLKLTQFTPVIPHNDLFTPDDSS